MKRLLSVLIILSLFLCACDIPELEEPVMIASDTTEEYIPNNDVFGVAYASNESADPYTSSNKINTELAGLICEPLFSVSPSFEVTPVLCSDYTYENLRYRFNIKDGVTFSDGSELRASDVEYSLRAASEYGSFYSTRLSVVQSISSSNKGGYVEVTLKYDNTRFPALLDIPIIKSGTRHNALPVGTGLYAPKDDRSALVARDGHHSGKTPKYSVISLCDVAGSDELVFEFDTHNVSILTSDPTGTTHIAPSSAAERISVPTTLMQYIGFNTRHSALANKNVRRAIASAIDRENAAQSDFALMGNASALPVHPKSAFYKDDYAKNLEYKPDTPISVSEPLTILVNSENSGKLAVCKRIAETLTRLGAATTVRALPFAEYTRALQSGDFTLYYAEVSIGADFDITRLISGSLNYGGFADASLRSALAGYLAGDEGISHYFEAFCDTVPFAPVLFKDTAMYTEKNFFETAHPTSQNIYHNFCDWELSKQ